MKKLFIFTSLIALIGIQHSFAQHNWPYCTDFDNDIGWTTVPATTPQLVTINTGVGEVQFTNTVGQQTDRIHAVLPSLINEFQTFSAEIDFSTKTIPNQGGKAIHPLALTAGSLEPLSNTWIAGSTTPQNQSGIMVSYITLLVAAYTFHVYMMIEPLHLWGQGNIYYISTSVFLVSQTVISILLLLENYIYVFLPNWMRTGEFVLSIFSVIYWTA